MTVAFLVFNRPECTARTLAVIRGARPDRLLVVADGPRPERAGEAAKCAQVRRSIEESIDWPCDFQRHYAETNLGCAQRVSSGLDWAFGISERLIVLEDDCLPDPTFFPFCEELLARYADDTRVGQICGTPHISSRVPVPVDSSYCFSRYGPIWGWASWARAWRHYDLGLRQWPAFLQEGHLDSICLSRAEVEMRRALYDRLHQTRPDTWDYQWGFAKMSQGLLSIIPKVSMIENIGFGADATHTAPASQVTLERLPMSFPLRHPSFVLPWRAFDRAYSRRFARPGGLGRLRKLLSAARGAVRSWAGGKRSRT